tara:strand:+ start:650 stop:877 length:228 start_codon:yes stop_codon:yes gene_type:complete
MFMLQPRQRSDRTAAGTSVLGGLNLFLWARNVFDVDYFDQLAANTAGNSGPIAGQPGDLRTFGLILASSFCPLLR